MAVIYSTKDVNAEDVFIIGDVILSIPPESINTFRVENNEEISALRSKFPIFTKTGQSLINATVVWKAVLGPDPTSPAEYYAQWNDLRRVVAIFKCAPFVQIENPHLRAVLGIDTDRMVFGLRQLTISTSPDSTDILEAALDLCLFNYTPFSKTFAYQDGNGNGVDSYAGATNSNINTLFSTYIDSWIAGNMQNSNDSSDANNWSADNTGALSFSYRTYKAFPNPPDPSRPGHGSVVSPYPGSDTYQDWVYDYATDYNTFYYYGSTINFPAGQFGDTTVTTGISVNFRNNFAQIPLSNYQYPTYQHLGPGTTTLNIALQTNDPDGYDFGTVQSALNVLNQQYKDMKPLWKKTGSTYGMQALFVTNQILNMLGITSILASSFTTSTDQDSQSVSAQLVASQYEDVFEVLEAFRIKDPSQSHLQTLQAISQPSVMNTLSPQAQKAAQPLTDYWTNQQNNNIPYLYQQLCQAPADPNATNSFTAALGTMPVQTGPSMGSDAAAFKAIAASNFPGTSIPVNQLVPALANRLNSGKPSYADLIILNGVYLNSLSGISNDSSSVDLTEDSATAKFNPYTWTTTLNSFGLNSNPTLQSAIYQALFPLLYTGNTAFSQAVDDLSNSPQFANAQSSNAAQANGPGSDPDNSSHGAYADIGIDFAKLGSFNLNPAYYLVDDSKTNLSTIQSTITSTLAASTSAAATANKTVNGTLYVQTTDHILIQNSITGNNNSDLFSRLNVEIQNPGQAFPTFKLFLLEDQAGKLIYAYDDFYSYSSVQSIEVIKYQDQPDAALIKISNVAGLLNHKLYDNSAEGFRDYIKDNTSVTEPNIYDSSGKVTEGTVASPDGSSVKGRAAYRAGTYYYDGNGTTASPLKYYPLQSGSKLQVRMGYSNNPDKLWPVFSGIVTELDEENEMITIMAQGFMIELTEPTVDYIASDHWSLSNQLTGIPTLLTESFENLTSGNLSLGIGEFFSSFNGTRKGAAYGGTNISDDGSALGVITQMIKAPSAKHFGKWQISSPSGTDPFIYGYQWGPLPLVSANITNTLSSLYDRSAVNIMTGNRMTSNASIIPSSSTSSSTVTRDWNYENTVGGPSEYHIPTEKTFTPWEIIKDVSRRYPENILAVKNYGFPWSCDATLVFANPYDFYRTRATSLTELGGTVANDKTDSTAFKEWWNSTGNTLFAAFGQALSETGPAFISGLQAGLRPVTALSTLSAINTAPGHSAARQSETNIITANYSYEEFTTYLYNWAVVLGNANSLNNRINSALSRILDNVFADRISYSERVKRARDLLIQLQGSAANYITKVNSGSLQIDASDLTLPVRKFHYVDANYIIHNGIKLNGDVYNAVKVGEQTIKISEATPDQHTRVLDCNDLLVDKKNVIGAQNNLVRSAYAQSFLIEEMGKMYKGELIVRGMPEIEPYDIVLINDPINAIKGPIRVKKIIHSYDAEMGYISIITPELVLLVNEFATASALSVLDYAITSTILGGPGLINAYTNAINNNRTAVSAAGVGAVTGAAAISAGLVTAGTLVGGTILAPVAIVGVLLLAAYGLSVGLETARTLTPVIPMPLNRFGRIWVAGMEGYRSENFFQMFADKYQGFVAEEFYPLIESWRALNSAISPSIAAPSGPTNLSGALGNAKPTVKKITTMPSKTEGLLQKYSSQYGFPLQLARGVAWVESKGYQFNPTTGALIKNPHSTATGVMQLVNGTAASLGVNSADWDSNVQGGVKYLAQLQKIFNGNAQLAVISYYDGPGFVEKNGPSSDGQQYLANVLYASS